MGRAWDRLRRGIGTQRSTNRFNPATVNFRDLKVEGIFQIEQEESLPILV